MMHCSAATPSVNTPSLFAVFGHCGFLLGVFECSHSQLVHCVWLLRLTAGSIHIERVAMHEAAHYHTSLHPL